VDDGDADVVHDFNIQPNSDAGALMPEIYVTQFVLFVMILLRVGSVIVTAPLVGDQAVPPEIKIGLSFFTAYVLYPMVSHGTPSMDIHFGMLLLYALKEVFLGVLLGFLLGIIFTGFRYAGELISYTMGISMANIFDPESSAQTPVIGEMLYLMAILLFLAINGHHFIFEALMMTYQTVPIGGALFSEPVVHILINVSSLIFIVAIKIAAPVLIAGFLTNFGLAVLARVMPQANIFILGFPITIAVGLLVLVSSAPFIVITFKKLLGIFESNIVELIRLI
jgi:flagellar biosynthetic protein FliR